MSCIPPTRRGHDPLSVGRYCKTFCFAVQRYNFVLKYARVGSGKFAYMVPFLCLYGVFFINFEFLIFNFELFFVPLHPKMALFIRPFNIYHFLTYRP